MDIVQIISVAGIGGIVGSLLTTIVQATLSHKSGVANRNFQEKKDAYIGLLRAYYQAALSSGDPNEKGKEFAYWQMRCELVAALGVRKAIQAVVDSAPGSEERRIAHGALETAMRRDLGVQPSE